LRCIGLGHLQQTQLIEAEHYLSLALRSTPDSPNLLNDLGIVKLQQQAYQAAVGFLQRALAIDPTHSDALNNIIAAFSGSRELGKAKIYLQRLMQVKPFSAQVYVKAANISLALNELEQAIRCGRKAVKLAPHQTAARLSLADSLEASGRFKQAKFQYLTLLAREPDQVIALSKMLSLRGTHIDEQHERQAQQLLKSNELKDSERARIHLGLAKYYDHRQKYDRAFEHLQAGNAVKFRKHSFDSNLFTQAVDLLISTFTLEYFPSVPILGIRSSRPVFIVGMPRSGTTLVEQVLASHSQIAAGGELSTITNFAAQMTRSGVAYPGRVRELDANAIEQMAQQYLDKLATISRGEALVTDKMPFNYMHLGLIVTLFPNARIIHCRRDALDTCLSCYFTTFSEYLQFASRLETLGRYYLDYRRLMAHWGRVLPVPMLEVEYERLVDNTEETIRGILSFCGVEWESGCMQFYRTERGIRTPSRWQVRQPIYGSSVGRWRNYEQHLGPLRGILSPALEEDPPESAPR